MYLLRSCNGLRQVRVMSENSNFNISLGAVIREHRKQKGLTQAQLADMVGLSTRHIGKLEDGTYMPKLSTYLNISNVLGFDFEEVKTLQKYAPREGEAKILNLLKEMNTEELKLSYKVLKALVNGNGEKYA